MASKIAFIGTGGTIASLGTDRFDILDYGANGQCIDAGALIERTQLQGVLADILPVNFRQIDSTAITLDDWLALVELCIELALDPDLGGIVIGHGTGSLEETAWLLLLVLDLDIPIVLTGAMRPLTGISTDAHANLAAAIRVAAAPEIERGVFVVINEEIHSPRALTKSHTLRLNAFTSPWSGPLGFVDGPMVDISRRQSAVCAGTFHHSLLVAMPRVDIVYSHVGADGCAIRAFTAAGAKGLVSAGFGPGMGTPDETAAFGDAVTKGVVVVQSVRTGGGPVVDSACHQRLGIIAGGDLSPHKARILLALCLARGDDSKRIAEVFQLV